MPGGFSPWMTDVTGACDGCLWRCTASPWINILQIIFFSPTGWNWIGRGNAPVFRPPPRKSFPEGVIDRIHGAPRSSVTALLETFPLSFVLMQVEFKTLPGLPGTGPRPEQFSATGQGTFREGYVVQFFPENREAWVGNFQPGVTNFYRAFPHPDDRTVVVVAGGQAYHVDPASKALIRALSSCIETAIVSQHHGILALADYTELCLLYSDGRCIESRRLSWDGIADLAFGERTLYGLAHDPFAEKWQPFAFDVETGEVVGGSFAEWKRIGAIRSFWIRPRNQRIVVGLLWVALLAALFATLWITK